jgi:uncharacterized protein
MERSIGEWVRTEHPPEKMLFLAGPRQVGKTTLAMHALKGHADGGVYLNWDVPADRRRILAAEDLLADVRKPTATPMVVFDELHKLRRFKAWLKGFYDAHRDECRIWVTGSGRLDLYQRGGDSLLGRYFLYRLHPLSLGEIQSGSRTAESIDPDLAWRTFEEGPVLGGGELQRLLRFGGFPEPYLRQQVSFHRRWITARRARVTHEDIRDLTRIDDLDRLEFLVSLLNPRVGAPLSVNSLREHLEVAFETVRRWIMALERVYYVFALRPYARKLQRSLRREAKYYYWDWSEVEGEAGRFENLVVSHLLKACHVWSDLGHGDFHLWYLRDKEKREVDALVTRDGKPWCLVEAKRSETAVWPPLVRFGEKLACPRLVQLVEKDGVRKRIRINGRVVHVASAPELLIHLP